MDLKKTYYYVICLVALFILFWGVVDLASASVSVATSRTPAIDIDKSNDQSLDAYYQKRIFYDRLSDSLARIVVAGVVFIFCRKKVA